MMKVRILSSFVWAILAVSTLVSCTVESVGKSEEVEYKPILSFRLDGEDRVARKASIKWIDGNSFEINAEIRDKVSNYDKISVRIVFSNMVKSDFPWARNLASSEACSTMSITMPNGATYSADSAPSSETNAGHAVITRVNETKMYISGKFDYTLYGNNTSIKLNQGTFNYIPYEQDPE